MCDQQAISILEYRGYQIVIEQPLGGDVVVSVYSPDLERRLLQVFGRNEVTAAETLILRGREMIDLKQTVI